jgi:Zn finger protein HypA/HybF involved in hydrogenase expression
MIAIEEVGMKKLVVGVILIAGLLSYDLAVAGQRGELSCSSCGYKRQLTVGGGRKSPRLTVYCPQCKTFSQKAFATWGEANKAGELACSTCSAQLLVYRGQANFPCPKCGRKTTRFKTLMHFD